MIAEGTIINTASVILGSSIGLLLRSHIKDRFRLIIFQAIGLFTVFLGAAMALKSEKYLILVFSLVLGALTGEALRLEELTEKTGGKIKRKLNLKNEVFTEGLVTAFLMFCMGSMTILGSFNEGLTGDKSLLLTKSVLDGFSSIILSATLGIGVLFAAAPLLLYQGALTIFAFYLKQYLSDDIITLLTSTGGILLIGLGFNILEIKKIKVINLIPALIYVIILGYFFG